MSEKNNVISPELWAPLEQEEKNAEKMERPSLTFLQDGWRRLKSNKIAILSLIVIALITIGAIFIPMFWKYDYKKQNLELANITCDGEKLTKQEKIKNKTYLLGTDGLGRDLFIRIVYGARISLLVGLFAAFINFVVGVFYGAIAGYCGGTVDNIMMRIIDVLDSIPMTLYVILIMVVVGPGISSIIIALGLTFWVKMARIVRGQVLTLKQQEFVKAAIVTGADTKRIIVKHLIPNMMGPIMVNMAMQIPSAIFNEAFLSFVGLGISAPMASWGTLCNDALAGIYVYPYQMVYPAIAISVTILTFNLLSDGLRDAFDPKQRK